MSPLTCGFHRFSALIFRALSSLLRRRPTGKRVRSVSFFNEVSVSLRFCASLLLILAGLLQACSNLAPAPESNASVAAVPGDVLELFPSDVRDDQLPVGWEKWLLHPMKRKTDYGWRKDNGGVYVEAKSHSSASGLIKRLNLSPSEYGHLQFSWMVDGLLEGADVAVRETEDSPVRVVLAFDGDKASLPVKDQAFFERVKTFTGQDMPYATLMYVWDNHRALNSVVSNPHTARVQKLVASSGSGGVKTWQVHARNIRDDYRAAFGKDPGQLIAIAIMTDTDNTKTTARARYRGLRLSKAPMDSGLKASK
jgi:Protein of unknown function (DUF3047)